MSEVSEFARAKAYFWAITDPESARALLNDLEGIPRPADSNPHVEMRRQHNARRALAAEPERRAAALDLLREIVSSECFFDDEKYANFDMPIEPVAEREVS